MKRRAFLIRTFTTAMSASVFTAVGWLMGSKTLTMQSGEPPPAPCQDGIVVGSAIRKCLNANCPSYTGDCYKDCYKFWCPDGQYWWVCNYSSVGRVCCEDTDCPT